MIFANDIDLIAGSESELQSLTDFLVEILFSILYENQPWKKVNDEYAKPPMIEKCFIERKVLLVKWCNLMYYN